MCRLCFPSILGNGCVLHKTPEPVAAALPSGLTGPSRSEFAVNSDDVTLALCSTSWRTGAMPAGHCVSVLQKILCWTCQELHSSLWASLVGRAAEGPTETPHCYPLGTLEAVYYCWDPENQKSCIRVSTPHSHTALLLCLLSNRPAILEPFRLSRWKYSRPRPSGLECAPGSP